MTLLRQLSKRAVEPIAPCRQLGIGATSHRLALPRFLIRIWAPEDSVRRAGHILGRRLILAPVPSHTPRNT